MLVVVIAECLQLARQVDYIPEEHAIEIFAANGADQPFDERMRNRDVRDRLDLLDFEYAQVGEPTVVRRMATENPLWGEERIANELLVKVAIQVSLRTVGKYLPKRPPGQPRRDQRWSTFLKNHAKGIIACDFFVAVTATFRLLYVFVVIMLL